MLIDAIKKKQATVGIIGLGYVGLPLAVTAAQAGFSVIGFDITADRVSNVNSAQNYIGDVNDDELTAVIQSHALSATTDFSKLKNCSVIIIAVPTPLDMYHQPDLTAVRAASYEIQKNIQTGSLVILESTTYPGTTEEVVLPIIEKSGLTAGVDFHIAFSPERVDPGNPVFKTNNTPKVVGGLTKQCTDAAAAFYQCLITQVHCVSSPRTAEMEKLLENIFRIVNISMINEMALLADRMNVDIWEVIQAASTKPYGYMPFYPGPGVGGHCIPVDPFYLSWKAREYGFNCRFIELAGEFNQMMPHYVVTKTMYALNKHKKALHDAKVLILGAAYKKDIADTRESAFFTVVQLLEKKYAQVSFHDPYISDITVTVKGTAKKYSSAVLSSETLAEADCVIILTDHSSYDGEFIAQHSTLVVDTRNCITSRDHSHVYRF